MSEVGYMARQKMLHTPVLKEKG